MKPFRENLILSIDGGGLRGIMVANALRIVEDYLKSSWNKTWHDLVKIAAGTSTGSIITSALMSGMSAKQVFDLYNENGAAIFKDCEPLVPDIFQKYIFDNKVLRKVLENYFGDMTLADIWKPSGSIENTGKDLIIVVRDLVLATTHFLKSWKDSANEWRLVDAILASTAVPTQFPVVMGRYVDGGLGSYSNPTYVAVFEAIKVRKAHPSTVTVLSIGTGKGDDTLEPGEADKFHILNWLPVVLETFLTDASNQQVNLVQTFMGQNLDFRRFQLKFNKQAPSPSATDPKDMPVLVKYGEELANMILNDSFEPFDPDFYLHPTPPPLI